MPRGDTLRLRCVTLQNYMAPEAVAPLAAEGIVNRAGMEEQVRRLRESGANQAALTEIPSNTGPAPGLPEFQEQACDYRPIYRRQYGEYHPQVQKLEAPCKAPGY